MTHELKKHTQPEWDGYDFDELVYERAVALARIEIEKDRMSMHGERLRNGNVALARPLFIKVLGLLNYADFIVIAVKLWRSVSPLFRKKK